MIWLVEQLVNWDFEFLSVSYIASELLLLLLYGMIQDYELVVKEQPEENTENSVTTQYSEVALVKDEEFIGEINHGANDVEIEIAPWKIETIKIYI